MPGAYAHKTGKSAKSSALQRKLTTFEQLAEAKTEVDLGRVFVDRLMEEHIAGRLTIEQAAEAKWWTTEMLRRVVDMGVQMHGGYGFMMEYPIAKAFLDARVQTIYGGTTEIMKEIVGRGMGL